MAVRPPFSRARQALFDVLAPDMYRMLRDLRDRRDRHLARICPQLPPFLRYRTEGRDTGQIRDRGQGRVPHGALFLAVGERREFLLENATCIGFLF